MEYNKILIPVLLIWSINLFSQQTNSNIDEKTLKFWSDTFKYGTTSQKLSILNTIKTKKINQGINLINTFIKQENNLNVKKEMISTLVSLNDDSAKSYITEILECENLSSDMIEFVTSSVALLKYKEAGKYLLKYLNNLNDIILKDNIIRTLGEIEYEEAIPTLLSIFTNEKNERIKTTVILSIANIKSHKSEDFLLSIFTNKSEKIINRGFAATGLGYIKTEKSFDNLLKNLDNAEPELKIRIIEALGNHTNKKAVDKFIECLKDDNKDIRYFSLKALSKLNIPEVKEIIEYKKNYDPEYKVRKLAEEILNSMEDINEKN